MVTRNCFATVKNTGKRIQLIETDLFPFNFYHGNRCWSEEELTDIVYEDDPKYQADIELTIANDEDWRIRPTHYTRRNRCEP